MLHATKMKYGCRNSRRADEIDHIYIRDCGWYKKEILHDHLVEHPRSIVVNLSLYPYLIPAVSVNHEQYV